VGREKGFQGGIVALKKASTGSFSRHTYNPTRPISLDILIARHARWGPVLSELKTHPSTRPHTGQIITVVEGNGKQASRMVGLRLLREGANRRTA